MYTKTIQNRRFVEAISTNRNSTASKSLTAIVCDGTQTGQKVPDHKSKIRAGLPAGSPFSYDKYTELSYEYQSARMSYYSTSAPQLKWTSHFSGCSQPLDGVNHLVFPTDAIESEALSRVYSKIRSDRSTINGMNVLGELRETIGMLRSPFKSLRVAVDRYFLSLEKRKKEILRLPAHKRRAEWSKAVSGTWLEQSFGWQPLISDSKAIAEAIAKVVVNGPKRKRILTRGELAQSRVSTPQIVVDNNSTFFNILLNTKVTTTRRIQYIVGMEYKEECAVGALGRLREQLGFTVENFVPTIYELTPWSWLVDYFTNVGDILEAATTDTSNVKWIVRTVSAVTEIERSSSFSPFQADYLAAFGYTLSSSSGSFGKSRLIRRSVNRTLPSTLGLPGLVLSHPGESFSKMANILSVWAQRRKGLQDLSYMPTYSQPRYLK